MIPKSLTDWMGNLIEENHIIVIIRTYPFFKGEVKSINFTTGEQKTVAYIPDNFQWEIIGEYKVIKVNNTLMYDIDLGNSGIIRSNISMIDFVKQPKDIICIKGVSDNKDKYIQFKGGIYSEGL